MLSQGDCLFIKRQINNKKKRVPYMILAVGKNDAGVPYNYIGIPITSQLTVGEKNLVEVRHPKLRKISYAKIIDPYTFKFNPKYMEVSNRFDQEEITKVVEGYIKFIMNGE